MKTRTRLCLGCFAAILISCGRATPAPPEPRPPSAQEADEQALGAAIRAALGDEVCDARAFDAATDLDGDGRPERVVYVAGPMLCGTGGCPALVLSPQPPGYRLVTQISVAKTPIWASPRETRGWRNLLVRIGGGGIASDVAELAFDGASYPSNPTVPPAVPGADTGGAELLIPEFASTLDGKPIPACPSPPAP